MPKENASKITLWIQVCVCVCLRKKKGVREMNIVCFPETKLFSTLDDFLGINQGEFEVIRAVINLRQSV